CRLLHPDQQPFNTHSLLDALPIWMPNADRVVFELQADLGTRHFLRLNSMETNESTGSAQLVKELLVQNKMGIHARPAAMIVRIRSEEHTSELQSRENLVCRLLLEK